MQTPDIVITTFYISRDLNFGYEVRDRGKDETLKRGWGYESAEQARLAGLEVKTEILKKK